MKITPQLFAIMSACILYGCTMQSSRYTPESVIYAQQVAQHHRDATNTNTTSEATATPAAEIPAAAPAAAPAADVAQEYTESDKHWIALVMAGGAKIKLEDGSVWEISPKFHVQTMYWAVSAKIAVVRNPNDQYPFKLTNRTKNVTVEARLISK